MAIIPGRLVPAPEPLRRRYGLFDAASGPLPLPDHAAGGGIRYQPETCGKAHAVGIDCYAPGGAPDKAATFTGVEDEVTTGVFATMATLLCGAVGYTEAELTDRVRRRLEMNEQAAVELALWTGEDFQGNPLEIRSLDSEAVAVPYDNYDPDDPDYQTIAEVVAGLERWAYVDQGYGSVATIHAPIEVASFAAESGLVLPEAGSTRKLTPGGSIWAFGAYPPGEVMITGQVTLWRSDEVSVAAAFENASNERVLLAERAWVASFDCFAGRLPYDPLEVTSP